jgi:hypothetical protein
MAFTPTTWVDGTTAITAAQLNRIETGIKDAHDETAATSDDLAAHAAHMSVNGLGAIQLAAMHSGTAVASGGTTAGSNLRAVGIKEGGAFTLASWSDVSFPGTWMNLGPPTDATTNYSANLWLRVS